MNDRYFRYLSYCLMFIFPWIVHAQKNGKEQGNSTASKPAVAHSSKSKKTTQVTTSKQKKAAFVRTNYLKGLDHFKKKKYQKALLLFMKVYRIQPNPNLVYNMARSFEELEQYDDAANYYEEYLKIHPKANDRDSILLSIKTLRALGKSKKPTPVSTTPVPNQTTAQKQSQQSNWWQSKRSWGWVAIGLSSLLVVGGVVYGMEASHINETMEQANNVQVWQQKLNERSDASRVADIFYVTASLSLGTALYLLLSDSGVSSPASQNAKKTVQSSTWDVQVGLNAMQLSWSF